MLGNYDKCKICGDRGIYKGSICDDCLKDKPMEDDE